jgi:hypothetical protein
VESVTGAKFSLPAHLASAREASRAARSNRGWLEFMVVKMWLDSISTWCPVFKVLCKTAEKQKQILPGLLTISHFG